MSLLAGDRRFCDVVDEVRNICWRPVYDGRFVVHAILHCPNHLRGDDIRGGIHVIRVAMVAGWRLEQLRGQATAGAGRLPHNGALLAVLSATTVGCRSGPLGLGSVPLVYLRIRQPVR